MWENWTHTRLRKSQYLKSRKLLKIDNEMRRLWFGGLTTVASTAGSTWPTTGATRRTATRPWHPPSASQRPSPPEWYLTMRSRRKEWSSHSPETSTNQCLRGKVLVKEGRARKLFNQSSFYCNHPNLFRKKRIQDKYLAD